MSSSRSREPARPPGQQRCQVGRCSRFFGAWDNHRACTSCRTCSQDLPCKICAQWTDETWDRFENRRTYSKKRSASVSSRSPARDVTRVAPARPARSTRESIDSGTSSAHPLDIAQLDDLQQQISAIHARISSEASSASERESRSSLKLPDLRLHLDDVKRRSAASSRSDVRTSTRNIRTSTRSGWSPDHGRVRSPDTAGLRTPDMLHPRTPAGHLRTGPAVTRLLHTGTLPDLPPTPGRSTGLTHASLLPEAGQHTPVLTLLPLCHAQRTLELLGWTLRTRGAMTVPTTLVRTPVARD